MDGPPVMTDYYTTTASVIFISIFFPILGGIFVALRFYTRAKANTAFWWDDWLCIPALVCIRSTFHSVWFKVLIVPRFSSLRWRGFCYGVLRRRRWESISLSQMTPVQTHICSSPRPNKSFFSKYVCGEQYQATYTNNLTNLHLSQIQYFFDLIGVFAFGSLKLSILFFYRKIFCVNKTSKDIFNTINTSMIAIVLIWTLTFGIGAIFLCGARPAYAWAPVALVAEHCSAQLPFLEAYAISDFIMDCFIWSLPIPKIWGLHMPASKRLSVVAVFLVGIL